MELFDLSPKLSDLISKVYRRYNYLKIDRSFYLTELITYLKENNLDYTKFNEENTKNFEEKINTFFIQIIKSKLENDECIDVINKYINNCFSYDGDVTTAVRNFSKLNKFFSKYDYMPSLDVCNKLLTENNIIKVMITDVLLKYKASIKEGNIDLELEDPTIILFIETYCILNNIQLDKDAEQINVGEVFVDKGVSNLDSINLFFRDLRDMTVLSPEEERELLLKYQETKDKKYRDILIQRNLKLVADQARRYYGHGLDFLDLVQEGSLGLMKAIDNFDANKGFKLSTYARRWIRQTIYRAIANKSRTIRMSARAHERLNSYNRIKSQIVQKTGKEPSLEEIAKIMDISPRILANILESCTSTTSINDFVGDDKETELKDLVADVSTNVEEEVFKSELSLKIKELFTKCKLKEREKIVLIKRYGLDGNGHHTLEEVGKMLDITRERARQIEAKALRRIKASPYKKLVVDWADNENDIERRDIDMPKKLMPLNEYLNNGTKKYTDKEIDIALDKLSKEEKELVRLRYMPDSKLTKGQTDLFYGCVIPKIKRLLERPYAKTKIKEEIKPIVSFKDAPVKKKEAELSLKELLNQGNVKYFDYEINAMLAKLTNEEKSLVEKYTSGKKFTDTQADKWSKIISKMQYFLKYPAVTTMPSEEKLTENKEQQTEKNKGKRNNETSLEEYLNKKGKKYSSEEIEVMFSKLNEEHQRIVKAKYTPGVELTEDEIKRFTYTIAPRMKFLLEHPEKSIQKRKTKKTSPIKKEQETKEELSLVDIIDNDSIKDEPLVIEKTKEEIVVPKEEVVSEHEEVKEESETTPSKEDYIKMLELLRTPTFNTMVECLSPKEAIIVSLKLGYVDGKYFSTEAIANFLDIEEDEVRDTTKKALLMYQESFVKMIDDAINVVTDAPVKKIGAKNN